MTFSPRFARWDNPPWWFASIALPWVIGLTLLGVHARRDSVRASREQTTTGVISGHDRGNHDSYEYTYSVGGHTFREWEIPESVEWRIGQQVIVYYDPLDPGESSLVDFDDRRYQDAGPIPFLLLGIAGILGYIGYKRYQNLPRSSTT